MNTKTGVLGMLYAPVFVCIVLYFLRDRFTPARSALQAQTWSPLPCAAVLMAIPSAFVFLWFLGYKLTLTADLGRDRIALGTLCFLVCYGFLLVSYFGAAHVCKVNMVRAFDLRMRRFELPLLICATLTLANLAAVRLVQLSFLPVGLRDPWGLEKGSLSLMGFAAYSVVVIFVGPIIEEIGFRGWLYAPFARKVGRRGAICLTSAIFTYTHFQSLPDKIPIFLIGLILAWLYDRTGSLAAPIVVHMFINSWIIYPYLLPIGR